MLSWNTHLEGRGPAPALSPVRVATRPSGSSATALTAPSRLEFTDFPDPQPGPGEVLLRIRACGINFADSIMAAGKYQNQPELPFTPGMEAVGEILALGDGVSGWSIGGALREDRGGTRGGDGERRAQHGGRPVARMIGEDDGRHGEADLAEVLGKEFITVYSEVKEVEYAEFMKVISPWEREHLLLHV